MTSRWMFSLAVLTALVVPGKTRAEAPLAKDLLADNAALCYWQAFAMLPKTNDELNSAVAEALDGQGAVDPKLVKIVEQAGPALHQLHRGAKISPCVWGLDADAGVAMPLPHLSQARRLARLACLRARVRLADGRASEAVDDLADAICLGCHVGNDGVLIVVLVDYAIERTAIQTAARYVPTLKPKDLAAFGQRLEELPPRATARQAMLAEKEIFLGWLIRELEKPSGKKTLLSLTDDSDERNEAAFLARLSQEELVEAAKSLLGVYDRIAEMMSLAPEAAKEAQAEVLSDKNLSEPVRRVARMVVPAAYAARHAEAVQETYWAMLKAAIAVEQHGKTALAEKEHRDPFGEGPFQYVEVEGGYQLRSTFPLHPKEPDKPVTLTFGAAQAK